MSLQIEQLAEELSQKNELLKEMEKQSGKALETILKLEQQGDELQKECDWLKQELDESQQHNKVEMERNIDLLNANRQMEDYIRKQ